MVTATQAPSRVYQQDVVQPCDAIFWWGQAKPTGFGEIPERAYEFAIA
jgi:hypothetical protein